jgi:hypothetical protein
MSKARNWDRGAAVVPNKDRAVSLSSQISKKNHQSRETLSSRKGEVRKDDEDKYRIESDVANTTRARCQSGAHPEK